MRFSRLLLAVSLFAIAGLSATASAGASTTLGSGMNSCPSMQQVMKSNAPLSSSGYLCANEYHDGDRSIGEWNTQTFSESTNAEYWPSYTCSAASNDNVTLSEALFMGSGTWTATNWDLYNSHEWSAGFVFTPEGDSVNGFDPECDAKSTAAWVYPPVIYGLSNITASGFPDNGVTEAGVEYSITASATPGGSAAGAGVALTDNGQTVAGGYMNSDGTLTFNWTPAEMGTHTLQVEWPGTSTTLGAYTKQYTVNVSGGTAVAWDTDDSSGTPEPVVTWGTNPSIATGTVNIDTSPNPMPAQVPIALIDANSDTTTPIALGVATPSSSGSSTGSAQIQFRYQAGREFKMIAKVPADSAAGISPGQSYPTIVNAPPAAIPTTPTRPSIPGHGAQPEPASIKRAEDSGSKGGGSRNVPPKDATIVDTGVKSVSSSRRVTSTKRTLELSCPANNYPLHAEGSTNGPDPAIRVSYTATGAKFTSPSGNAGKKMTGNMLCRRDKILGVLQDQRLGYGTQGADAFWVDASRALIFAGPGPDSLRLTGTGAVGLGGVGDDRLSAKGRDSSLNGGPGTDALTALGTKRILLIGGSGRDLMTGSNGPVRFNAVDGQGGDRVICRSSTSRALIDRGDKVTGPCKVTVAGTRSSRRSPHYSG